MIGDDVVDLADPETREAALHPRFDERVLTARERRALARSGDRSRLRWSFWAAKEAAFKALRREDPRRPFSPIRLDVELGEDGCGVVLGEDSRHAVAVRVDAGALHAVARAGGLDGEVIAALGDLSGDDPSAAVRRFAIDAIAARVGVASESLEIVSRSRVPSIVVGADVVPVSFAHHGSVVGFAAILPHLSPLGRGRREAAGEGETYAGTRSSSPHPALSPRGGGWRLEECFR